jgi:hypothetical protein
VWNGLGRRRTIILDLFLTANGESGIPTRRLSLIRPPSGDNIPNATLRDRYIPEKAWYQVDVQMHHGLARRFSHVDADVVTGWFQDAVKAALDAAE